MAQTGTSSRISVATMSDTDDHKSPFSPYSTCIHISP